METIDPNDLPEPGPEVEEIFLDPDNVEDEEDQMEGNGTISPDFLWDDSLMPGGDNASP